MRRLFLNCVSLEQHRRTTTTGGRHRFSTIEAIREFHSRLSPDQSLFRLGPKVRSSPTKRPPSLGYLPVVSIECPEVPCILPSEQAISAETSSQVTACRARI